MRAMAVLLGVAFFMCICLEPNSILLAQRGPGGGGKGPGGGGAGANKGNGAGGAGKGGAGAAKGAWGKGAAKMVLPQLQVEDVKPEGGYALAEMFAPSAEQPRIGVTDDYCYRLAEYQGDGHSLKFAFYDFKTQQLRAMNVKLAQGSPGFQATPRMGADSGQWCVVSLQALTLFVEPKTGKAKLAAGYDKSVPMAEPRPPQGREWENREKPPLPAASYRVHALSGGKYALSVLTKYDGAQKALTGADAVLHSAEGKSVTLKFSHAQFGVPPRERDGVFAVVGNDAIVLTAKPRTPGDFDGPCDLACLVFDAQKGDLKDAQVHTDACVGKAAGRFALSPDGGYVVAQSMESYNHYLIKRGTWERVYTTQYHDACVGFAPEGNIGVFVGSKTPERASVTAYELSTMKVLWATTVSHTDVQGEGKDEPFYSVGAGARTLAARFGVIKGTTRDLPEVIYGARAIEFTPLSMAYDSAGKKVAVLALDRIFVLDARTCEEVISVPFEKPLPKGMLGEFVAFSDKGDKIAACVRGQGAWIVDVATSTITAKLPPINGTWARPMPDFSGVVYSQPESEGGNVMCAPFAGGEPKQIFRCGYKDSVAVCLWISDRANEFLITERKVGEGSLQLIDDKGRVVVKYDVAEVDPMYVGDSCVTAFVTRKREAVLINEVNQWEYTGVNCTVVSPESGGAIKENFSFVFKSEDLPGRSTYGTTAAAPFFGLQHYGDENDCAFACPAGVLSVSVGRNSIKLNAWSRKPQGFCAVNPRQKEFFVAGSNGLTTYKFK